MRLAAILLAVLLSGCAATKAQVTSALGDKYSGKSVDALVLEFGPPKSSFQMASGETAYQWELTNRTNIDTNQYGGSARTFYCRVRAIVGHDSIVRSVSTEDAANLLGESLCAQKLGLMRNA
jgi:hypothetical protein